MPRTYVQWFAAAAARVAARGAVRAASWSGAFSTAARGTAGGAASVLAVHAIWAAPAAVVCKSPDTPDYLLPYYLRSTRARFNHYASIREKGGVRYMTTEDFVAAMLALKDTSAVTPAAKAELDALFLATDADGDGRISYREFAVLSILLCTPMDDFRLAFTVLDVESKGGLNRAQFRKLLSSLGDETMKPTMKSGIVAKLFPLTTRGTAEQRKAANRLVVCDFKRFEEVVLELERAVSMAEFKLADAEGRGFISRRAFGELLTSSILGRHLPFFIVDNLRQMDGSATGEGSVSVESWLRFNDLLKHSDAVSEALTQLSRGGVPVRRADFVRAVNLAGQLSSPLTSSDVDLIFELFDRDRDGTLELDEFVALMKSRATYNVVEPEKRRANVFVQAAKCGRESLEDAGLI